MTNADAVRVDGPSRQALFAAIAARDHSAASTLLATSPRFAQQGLVVGARGQREASSTRLMAHGARASDEDAAGRSLEAFVKADWIRALLTQSSH